MIGDGKSFMKCANETEMNFFRKQSNVEFYVREEFQIIEIYL